MVGHETTVGHPGSRQVVPPANPNFMQAATTAFTFMELARNQASQTKLREEILSLGTDFNVDSIQKLPYLEAVIREGSVILCLFILISHS